MELSREERITLDTYNAHAEEWARAHATPGFWKKEMDMFHSYLPSGAILEIGVGGGRDAKELIARGYAYTGIDISEEFIAIAERANPSGTFLRQSVYDLSFPEGMLFDGFWAAASLLHIPKSNIVIALQKIAEYLKKDAVGFISLKYGEGEGMEEGGGRFFAYYSENEFKKVLTSVGFKTLHVTVNPMSDKITWLCFFVSRI